MDTKKSSVFRPTEGGEDLHPHACTDGLVFLAYTVHDEEVGEEVERLEVVPCRWCASEAEGARETEQRKESRDGSGNPAGSLGR